jgi:hypothetical protein
MGLGMLWRSGESANGRALGMLSIFAGTLPVYRDEPVKFCEQMAELTRHIPPAQFGQYLSVGTLYALFGYGTFTLFTAVLNPSFLAHERFPFRTPA